MFWDSVRVRGDLFVGSTSGAIYLDTNREGSLYFGGYSLYLSNTKENGSQVYFIGEKNSSFNWYKTIGGEGTALMQLDTASGLVVKYGDIQLTGGTQQIKVPSDTVSDYNWDDAVTLNKQSGVITTDTLLTVAGAEYSLTLTNSLIAATSKVFVSMTGNNISSGIPMVWAVVPSAGSAIIYLRNIHASATLNSWVKLSFLVLN